MLTDELLVYVFDGQPHLLAQAMAPWLVSSRRFAGFIDTFKDKIRKKVRSTRDKETLLDLRLELETAYLLLREQRLSLVYEPGQTGKLRRPDFAVTFTTSLTFMVEVTRLRADKSGAPAETEALGAQASSANPAAPAGDRLTETIFSKMGQLLPQHGNVLVIGVAAFHLTSENLRAAMLRLQQRAERADSGFLKRYQFRDRADFFRHHQRLSEILVRGSDWQEDNSTVAWTNPQAKHPLPGKVRAALYRSHAV